MCKAILPFWGGHDPRANPGSEPFTRLPPPNTNTPCDDAARLTIFTILRSMHTKRPTRCSPDFLPLSIPRRSTLQRTNRFSFRREGSSIPPWPPEIATTHSHAMISAPSSGPETSERRMGGNLVRGHVRNFCGSHGCGVL